MIKHTHTIRRLLPTNCFSVFDYFLGLVLIGLRKSERQSDASVFAVHKIAILIIFQLKVQRELSTASLADVYISLHLLLWRLI